jgi:segregation and condensation protein A
MTDTPDPPDPPEGAAPKAAHQEDGPVGGYRVQLPTFEGPLDLLLHLIEEHELDIRDIPIAFIAKKYVEYITLMEALNIDIASEYLVMAATLTHIKSKMLLPVPPDDQDDASDEAELDPRAELVRRLLEYQKYKNAAEQLGGAPVLGRDVFTRGLPAPSVEGPAPLAGLSLFKLLDAFQSVLSRAKTTVDHQIDFERFSITDRINELSDVLRQRKVVLFVELFDENASRADLIITFLALLEMTRLRLTRLMQSGPLEPITVELSVSEDDDAAFAEVNAGFDDSYASRPAKPYEPPQEEDEETDSEDEDDEDDEDEDEDDDSGDDEDDDSGDDESQEPSGGDAREPDVGVGETEKEEPERD